MRGRYFLVLRLEGVEGAREFLEVGFGFAQAEVARLLERGKRFGDARDGVAVGSDVEVLGCVGD